MRIEFSSQEIRPILLTEHDDRREFFASCTILPFGLSQQMATVCNDFLLTVDIKLQQNGSDPDITCVGIKDEWLAEVRVC